MFLFQIISWSLLVAAYNLPRRHRHRRLRPACLPWRRRAEQTKTVLGQWKN